MVQEVNCVRLSDLKIEFTGEQTCENISLIVREGELTVLTGRPTPCWNMFLRQIAGQNPIQAGQIELWDIPISQYGRRRLDSLVWFYSQQQQVPFAYPAYDFILKGCEIRLKPLHSPGDYEKRQAAQIIRQLGLENLISRDFSRLNRWDRQRVLLARAMMQEARLLLLDDPFEGISDDNKAELAKLSNDLVRINGLTIILSTADHDLAERIADQLILFDQQGFAGAFRKDRSGFSEEAKAALSKSAVLDLANISEGLVPVEKPHAPAAKKDSGRLF